MSRQLTHNLGGIGTVTALTAKVDVGQVVAAFQALRQGRCRRGVDTSAWGTAAYVVYTRVWERCGVCVCWGVPLKSMKLRPGLLSEAVATKEGMSALSLSVPVSACACTAVSAGASTPHTMQSTHSSCQDGAKGGGC